MVLEYINNNGKGIPIFIEEIKEYIIKFYNEKDKEKVFNNVKTILNRMNKEGIIETAYKGIYYIPNENIFGKMLLSNRQIIQYKYIMDKEGNIKGYVTGAKLFNEAHLTTQVPNVIDIATNECKNFNKYENKKLNVIIRKPKMAINNENYKYLQLFDLIENKDNIGIEVNNPDEIIYDFIKENKLDFEKIIKYAMDTKSRTVINKILVLAKQVVVKVNIKDVRYMIYFIADTHFNHENIIKYCNRPFKNSQEMNEYIIKKWNSVVKKEDTVYHLGDVGFGTTEMLKELVGKLNGKKILLRGNHDFKRGLNGWKEVGFSEVYKKKIELGNLVLTHAPIELEDKEKINVFGHIHDKPLDERFDKDNHICVSCDVVDYTPIIIEK